MVDMSSYRGMHKNKIFKNWKLGFILHLFLRQPIKGHPFLLDTNWSAFGLGIVLTQLDDENQKFVVTYASQSFNQIEVK